MARNLDAAHRASCADILISAYGKMPAASEAGATGDPLERMVRRGDDLQAHAVPIP